jgi:Uma2 family endonuclease
MKTLVAREKKKSPLANGTHSGSGIHLFVDDVHLHVPGWVANVDSFRQWVKSDEFPETGNIWWLRGEVWADMSKEQIFSHVDVKGAIFAVLYLLVRQNNLGRVFTDGFFLTNQEANISGKPDGVFLAHSTFASERVRLIEGARGGAIEVQGSPDMVLEVVSESSIKKDTVTLLDAYWKAGVTEYWLVDVRADSPSFEIFRHTAKGFRRAPTKHGWTVSGVFGKWFQLTMATDRSALPEYTLGVK